MTGTTGRTFLASTALILTLGACAEGELFGPGGSSGASSESTSGGLFSRQPASVETREVEAPDVFSTNESGLWDGRPSLGGIWVAHPDVTSPERVRITNASNGQVVNGALFRRERNNPGPRIQVSSDAADELGILAGQPTELVVVALREEEIEVAPVLAPDGAAPTDAVEAGDEVMTAEAATVDDLAVDAGGTAMATADAAPKPKRQGFFAALFGSGASQEEPIETEVVSTDGDVIVTEGADAPGVETASLDDPIASAAAAIDAAEASTAPASSLNNPFVQVGTFTNEENAEAAANNLREIGIVPNVVAGNNGDRDFWRVLVGPMTNPEEQTFMLEQIRLLGYNDAFLAPS